MPNNLVQISAPESQIITNEAGTVGAEVVSAEASVGQSGLVVYVAADATHPLAVNPAESGAANLATAQVTVSSASATPLLAANATRRSGLITNMDTSIAIYIGGASVTTGTGHYLGPGLSMSIPFVGAIYAIAASGSPKASASEVYD